MAKTKIVGMILAGGKGSRLLALTHKNAKPGISFGGKYRIIDYTLSNCANSNVNIVGVLTQYESTFLNTYIGNGEKWGLNGVRSLTATLTPRQTDQGQAWYAGTADAIYQNLEWLDEKDPAYVLILSGDHIYHMDYELMLNAHIENDAALTIAVLDVSLEEASRFGIMITNEDGYVIDFEEKPAKPKSTLASMGIYIFNYKRLREALMEDARDPNSSHDFGKNIIPSLLKANDKIYAYVFDGYWKDVGTISSYWRASMDIVDEIGSVKKEKGILGKPIYTEDTNSLPQYIGKEARIKDSVTNQGAIILGEVSNSIIFNEVEVHGDSHVTHSVIMPNVIIEKNCEIAYAVVGPEQVIKEGTKIIGTPDDIKLVAI
ncbi:MAG: glucose-1-phosphate adenylyltransferase [Erysipelotrichaceae bacterium]|nr:glucose-1-phosphate adenylyltransferase [Erysipelotrichaceae bacterium]